MKMDAVGVLTMPWGSYKRSSSVGDAAWREIELGFHGNSRLKKVLGVAFSSNSVELDSVDEVQHDRAAARSTEGGNASRGGEERDGGGGEDGAAEQARDLQDAAAALLTRARAEEEALRRRAAAVQGELRRLCEAAAAHADSDKVEEDLDRATCLIADGDVAALLPSKTQGAFLKMFLGPVNLRATRKEVQLKVKEEYNSYRDRTALLFLGFPVILLFLRKWLWNGCFPALPVQLYQAWLLFLYTSLALRENILRVNGSDIRPWWILHHYCAMLMSLISLTWEIKGQPNCARKQRGVELFLCWAIMQGFVMMLQNRYQRQRLYTRIALGKAKRMDVVWGETAGVEGILSSDSCMLPNMTTCSYCITSSRVVVCGILLIAMAIGNFANTVDTLMAKSRFKAKMKKSKGKRDLDTCPSPTGSSPQIQQPKHEKFRRKSCLSYEHCPCLTRVIPL
ncbi:unnamed protein product [Miscanthus lutarioriparius]|uniref:TMPIT-like protein n=1 Tax=Miscanthus lutarioriparius TaxID=422564 RepID=A0A811SI67_9POAL|nr:unnamed protein product [Miscanthus lutarioriparius]